MLAEMPAVTTVIPAFNAERYLGEAIESALAQDYRPHELIVVDDGSADRTAGIAGGYPGVRVIRQANQGPAAARNAAIAAAGGELIAILDADDRMVPGRLPTQVGYLLEHPEAGAVLGMQELDIEGGAELPVWAGTERGRVPGSPDANQLPFEGVYVTSTMLARRRAFEAIGGYDTSFRYAEDVDWVLRLMESEMTVGTVDEVAIVRRIHAANLTHNHDEVRRALFRVFQRRIARHRTARSAVDPEQPSRRVEPERPEAG